MKILYVVHDFFPRYYGGTERYVLNLARQMQRMGHEAQVLTYGLTDPAEDFPETLGAMLSRSYTYGGLPVVSVRHRQIPEDIGFRIADDEVVDAVKRLLAASGCDVVHIAHPMRLAACYRAARETGVGVVLTLTDFWLLCPRGRFFKPDYTPCNSPEEGKKCVRDCEVHSSVRDRYRQARRLFEEVDALIAPSRFLIDIYRRCGWTRAIAHVKHGVDYSFVSPLPRQKRANGKLQLGYTGVVTRFKGVDLLLSSFMAVDCPDITLKIYGNVLWDESFRAEIGPLRARGAAAGDGRHRPHGGPLHDAR
jgi:glycosyltransferase involved in cell wall biosynthesis